MRRFFQSKLEDSALKAKGTCDLKAKKKTQKERVVKVCAKIYHGTLFIITSVLHLQKLESRRAALERTSALSEEQKTKWQEVLVSSFISSEESGEVIDGETVSISTWSHFLGGKLRSTGSWDRWMKRKRQSKQAKHQTLPLKPGTVFTCPKPTAEFGAIHFGHLSNYGTSFFEDHSFVWLLISM